MCPPQFALLPFPAPPLPNAPLSLSLSPQVRIRLGSLRWLGGCQPHRAGRVPPVLLLPRQRAAGTAVLPTVAAFDDSGVRLIPNPALLLPTASLPSPETGKTPALPPCLVPGCPTRPFFSSSSSRFRHHLQRHPLKRGVWVVIAPLSIIARLPPARRVGPPPGWPGPWVAGPRPSAEQWQRRGDAAPAGARCRSRGGVLHRSALCCHPSTSHPPSPSCFQEQAGSKAGAWFSRDEAAAHLHQSQPNPGLEHPCTPLLAEGCFWGASFPLPHCHPKAALFLIIINS